MVASLLSSSLAVVHRPPSVVHYTGPLHWVLTVQQLASLESVSGKAREIKQEENREPSYILSMKVIVTLSLL